MASNFENSIHRGSDLFFDLYCFTCHEHDKNREVELYCEQCSKLYCCECVEYHNILYKKHDIVTFGKESISQWPVSNASFDVLEQCSEHKKELTAICESHSELLCHLCHIYNHQKCTHVVVLADKVKALNRNGEFKQLSATVEKIHEQLIQKKNYLKERMKSLENNFNTILEEINNIRKAFNASLDELGKNTIKELDTLLATMRTSIQTDIDHCTESIKTMTCVQQDWQNIKDKNETIHLIMYRKCLDQSLKTEAVLKEIKTKNDSTLTFEPDTTIQKNLSALSGLGRILGKEKQSQTVGSTTHNTVNKPSKPINNDLFSLKSYSGNQTGTLNNFVPGSNPYFGSSRNLDPGNQTSATYKTALLSNPLSGSFSQPQSGNQTSTENNPDKMSNHVSSSSSKSTLENKIKDVSKPDMVSNPVSSSFSLSHPANQTSAVNASSIVSNQVSILSSQAELKKTQVLETSHIWNLVQTYPSNGIKAGSLR